MQTRLNPYLNFENNAREAMEFYKEVFGGELDVSTYKEGGMPYAPEDAEKIMHAMLLTDGGMALMLSDNPPGVKRTVGDNIAVSLSGDEFEELKGYWDKLIVGGNIIMPLEKAPWGDVFGMCTDKFGINWLVNIAEKKS